MLQPSGLSMVPAELVLAVREGTVKQDKLCERKVAHFVLQLRAESLACAPARR